MSDTYWQNIGATLDRHDPHCQGVIVLGLNGTVSSITESFLVATKQPWVKGFAIGRTIFSEPATQWFAREIDDTSAMTQMRRTYRSLIDAWDAACEQSRGA
ncbi:MAG: DUF2090 domain-containing protein [Gammaproteobacteria bacterium]|nr:DUF2090 domain-containing protein [Gammaproteobacteria bacterium]